MIPGRRTEASPDDLYSFGADRGGINERWFSSTTKASNGPATTPDEGLSYVHPSAGARFLLKDAVESPAILLLGADVMEREGDGTCYASFFFDNMGPPFHTNMHQSDEFAKLVGHKGKPEAYYFPPQYNQLSNNFTHTYMGLEAGYNERRHSALPMRTGTAADNGIIFHAPLTVLSQAVDGRSIRASFTHPVRWYLRASGKQRRICRCSSRKWKAALFHGTFGQGRLTRIPSTTSITSSAMLDWDANVNPEFGKTKQAPSGPCASGRRRWKRRDNREVWIELTGSKYYSGQKELTVLPGRSVTHQGLSRVRIDNLTQGYGTLRRHSCFYSVDDPVRRTYRRRTVLSTAAAAKEGVAHQESKYDRPACHPETLRSGASRCRIAAQGSLKEGTAMSTIQTKQVPCPGTTQCGQVLSGKGSDSEPCDRPRHECLRLTAAAEVERHEVFDGVDLFLFATSHRQSIRTPDDELKARSRTSWRHITSLRFVGRSCLGLR